MLAVQVFSSNLLNFGCLMHSSQQNKLAKVLEKANHDTRACQKMQGTTWLRTTSVQMTAGRATNLQSTESNMHQIYPFHRECVQNSFIVCVADSRISFNFFAFSRNRAHETLGDKTQGNAEHQSHGCQSSSLHVQECRYMSFL